MDLHRTFFMFLVVLSSFVFLSQMGLFRVKRRVLFFLSFLGVVLWLWYYLFYMFVASGVTLTEVGVMSFYVGFVACSTSICALVDEKEEKIRSGSRV